MPTPGLATSNRAADALSRTLRSLPHGSSPARTAADVLRAIQLALPADGGALVLMDPQTRLFTTGAVSDLPAPSCHPFFRFEMDSPSQRTFRRLAATGVGATGLSLAGLDDGYAGEVLEPYGFADELRVVCRSAGTVWGAVSLWRRPSHEPFTAADEEVLDAVAEQVGRILRDAVVASISGSSDGVALGAARHVVLLDGGRVVEATERTLEDLAELADPQMREFRHLDHLRQLAENNPRFSTVIGMEDGRWLAAHGMPLGPGRVAITLTAATPADLFGVVVAGAGLTPREVEVVRMLCRGHSDAEIAGLLTISPHTVHDHVRAIRGKLGVRSRAEVAAKVFAERYFTGFLASAAVTHLAD